MNLADKPLENAKSLVIGGWVCTRGGIANYGYRVVMANGEKVENPTVTVGSSSITFNTTIEGGNYIEYFPETNKAYQYDNYTQTSKEISFTGSLTIPTGNSTGTYTANVTDGTKLRAKVVFGFAGETVDNIK
jgi:hypothetical protein